MMVLWLVLGVLPLAIFAITLITLGLMDVSVAAQNKRCKNNLTQIGMALSKYHDAHGSFPPAFIADKDGNPMHSWRVLILPQLGEAELHAKYDFSQPWDSPTNASVLESMPQVFRCPSEKAGDTLTNYVAAVGGNAVFQGAEPVARSEITDDAGLTLIIGEASGVKVPWLKPQDLDVDLLWRRVTRGDPIHDMDSMMDPKGFSSPHKGGTHVLCANGKVVYARNSLSNQHVHDMLTRNGGEVIETD